jgi:hypothetical protein
VHKSWLDRRLPIANCQDLAYSVGLTCRLGSYIDEVPRFLKRGEITIAGSWVSVPSPSSFDAPCVPVFRHIVGAQ